MDHESFTGPEAPLGERIPPKLEPRVLSMDQVADVLVSLINPLPKARIVLEGFSFPDDCGGTSELEYGNIPKLRSQGLGIGAVEMGKAFVMKMIEELFSGEMGDFVPEGTRFQLSQEEGVFTLSALTPE